MMMKTRIFIAKSMAKKSYKDAIDAIKTFKADKAGGKMFTKIKTTGKKIPGFVKSNLKAIKKFDIKAKAMASGSKVKAIALKARKNPGVQGFGKGAKIGTFAAGGLAVGSGAYNLATGQRNVRVDKKTAKKIKVNKIKKKYNI
tara:strand:+ start:77 stop:505 length:429 start_codon:yes stop_codon:yes gene_type:complete